MDRRRFLELASITGLGIAGAPLLGQAHDHFAGQRSPSRAGEDDYDGPLFVMVQAHGGWDPTLLCDPKGNLNESYGDGDILTSGNLRYAPVPGAQALFDAHYSRTAFINGIDMSTNAHDAGQRNSASGRLGEGYPALAAMVAGHGAPQRPMSFLSFGAYYDRTSGLVAPTRNGNAAVLAELSYPDRMDATSEAAGTYHTETGHALIRLARSKRTERAMENQSLPRFRHALDSLTTARLGSDALKRLEEVLPDPASVPELHRQAQLVVAAYKARVGVAGNLRHSNFDTHSNHDAEHRTKMSELLGLVKFLWDEAERQEVADKLVVLIVSDFGRTPQYNGNRGKDHWPVTSMVAMGAGINGNRMVGATSSGHDALMIDPATGAQASSGGIKITPAHVHRGMRRVLGLSGTVVDESFPIALDDTFDPVA